MRIILRLTMLEETAFEKCTYFTDSAFTSRSKRQWWRGKDWKIWQIEDEHSCQQYYEISGSHGGEDIDVGFMGCDAVWACR